MNDLYSYYVQHRNSRVMHKWEHYFEIYDRFLSPIRRSNPVILEIGVQLGGSCEMWRDYFGPATHIFGIDINPETLSPRYNIDTYETNVPGLFVAGGQLAGKRTGTVFIENGRFHGAKIIEVIAGRSGGQ